MNIKHANSDFATLFPRGFPETLIIPITEAEILNTVTSLNSKNFKVCKEILKLCGHQLSKSLVYICSKSLSLGEFPNGPKSTITYPFFKKGDKLQLSKYRQISVLTGFL